MKILTEQEVKNSLDIKGYPDKYKKAIWYAQHINDTKRFWNDVREHFLQIGGELRRQNNTSGKNNRF